MGQWLGGTGERWKKRKKMGENAVWYNPNPKTFIKNIINREIRLIIKKRRLRFILCIMIYQKLNNQHDWHF